VTALKTVLRTRSFGNLVCRLLRFEKFKDLTSEQTLVTFQVRFTLEIFPWKIEISKTYNNYTFLTDKPKKADRLSLPH
jgi:hypothetical protein